ncbi:MAG: hypothetical protein ACHQF4_08175 [Sphingobacteriales bacterium]
MKKIIAIAFFAAICTSASAQKYVPVIKEGTVLNYDAYSVGLGQHIPLVLTVKSLGDPVILKWDVEGYGTGTFEIPAKAMQTGTRLVFKQPDPDGATKLKDNETIIVLSKSIFNSLVTDKAAQINGMNVKVVPDTTSYKINNKPADVFHAATDNGKYEIWVINNPDFPLIYRGKTSKGAGIDITLTGIKE